MMQLVPYLLCLLALSASAQVVITLGLEGAAGGAPTFLIDEDFEGTGAPTGWAQIVATCDWDESTTVLAGSKSLEASASGSARCRVDTAGDIDEIWYYQLIRFNDVTLVQTRFLSLRTLADSEVAWLEINATDGIACMDGGSITEDCWDTAISSDTMYHLFVHYKKSSGASDGVAEFGYSTDGSVPFGGDACCTQSITHNVQIALGKFQLRSNSTSAGNEVYSDNVLIDDEAIGAQ